MDNWSEQIQVNQSLIDSNKRLLGLIQSLHAINLSFAEELGKLTDRVAELENKSCGNKACGCKKAVEI